MRGKVTDLRRRFNKVKQNQEGFILLLVELENNIDYTLYHVIPSDYREVRYKILSPYEDFLECENLQEVIKLAQLRGMRFINFPVTDIDLYKECEEDILMGFMEGYEEGEEDEEEE